MFPRTMIAEGLNKGVLVVYLCAYNVTRNKCTYYFVKSCNVAIDACNLEFLDEHVILVFFKKKKRKKKEKESKQG